MALFCLLFFPIHRFKSDLSVHDMLGLLQTKKKFPMTTFEENVLKKFPDKKIHEKKLIYQTNPWKINSLNKNP